MFEGHPICNTMSTMSMKVEKIEIKRKKAEYLNKNILLIHTLVLISSKKAENYKFTTESRKKIKLKY